MHSPELLFLLGAGRSGTSTTMGILNCVPSIFLLFEVNANLGADIRKRDREFLNVFPELAPFHGKKPNFESYSDMANFLAEQGHPYRYFGAKFPSINLTASERLALRQHKAIWCGRDIRTWMCKNNNVYSWKLSGQNSVPLAVEQVWLFVESFLYPKILRLSMEDLVFKNDECIARLGRFLDIPMETYTKEWWARVGDYPPGDHKGRMPWWDGHDSSRLKPVKLDTDAKLTNHPFWQELLPLFDKYYTRLDTHFPESEVQADLDAIGALKDKYTATLEDLYDQVNSISFGSGPGGEKGHLSSNTALQPFKIKANFFRRIFQKKS